MIGEIVSFSPHPREFTVNPTSIPDGAVLLPPPTLAERYEIKELMRVVRAYTHPVIFNEKDDPHFGTAVFLRHGKRLFAFTAAHNLKEDITIIVRLSPDAKRTKFDILSRYKHPKYAPDPFSGTSKFDLAILELENDPSVTAGDVCQISTGDLGKLPDGDHKVTSNAFVWLMGYPVELIKPGKNQFTLYQTSFGTQILDFSPEELSVVYPETGYQMPHDGTTCEVGKMTKTPVGYSGGGVWVVVYKEGELFNPHKHIKLVGIETHWSGEKTRLARCVRSNVITESLKEFKPELR